MAIWQFSFVMVPEEKIANILGSNIEGSMTKHNEELMSWKGYCIKEGSLVEISKVLAPTKSWADNIKQYGVIDESCLELYYEEDEVIEISVRLDLRSLSKDILEAIVSFIKVNKGMISTKNGNLIKPTVDDILSVIKTTDAYRFVKEPEEFVRSIK